MRMIKIDELLWFILFDYRFKLAATQHQERPNDKEDDDPFNGRCLEVDKDAFERKN